MRFAAVVLVLLSTGHAWAADAWPSKPIRLVVPTGAGGITDILARIVADRLRGPLGQQVVVDNRPGAGGIVGSEIVARANPDGYTLLVVFPSHPVNPSLYPEIPYDTVKDFAPVSILSIVHQVLLVNPSSPARTVRDLLAIAREKPGQLNCGSVGRGSLGHLSSELLASMAGIRIVHVAYKGAPQVMSALFGNEVQIYFNTPVTALPQVKAGKVRALAVGTRTRLPVLPDVPTVAESGVPGYESIGWNGILAPAKTPRAVIDRLNGEIARQLRAPDAAEQLASQGIDAVNMTPDDFAKLIRDDVAKWAKVIKAAGIRAN